MELEYNGRTYETTDEIQQCHGCAFEGNGILGGCGFSQRAVKCGSKKIIWVAKSEHQAVAEPATNKYQRTVKSTTIDVYDVLAAWNVTNPAVQHAIKKLLQPGARGHKSKKQDLEEALASIKRAIELEA